MVESESPRYSMPARLILSTLSVLMITASATGQDAAEGGDSAPPEIEQVSGDEYRLGQIEFNSRTREIRFPGQINQQEYVIEYVLVHELGKTHESLLSTPVSPFNLNVVLKLLNYQAGRGKVFDFLYPNPDDRPASEPLGSGVDVLVSWDGKEPVPVSEMVEDLTMRAQLKDSDWHYTGSTIREGKFMAEVNGSIIALYVDEFAMLNLLHDRAGDDENWFPFTTAVPPVETPVTIHFRPRTNPSTSQK